MKALNNPVYEALSNTARNDVQSDGTFYTSDTIDRLNDAFRQFGVAEISEKRINWGIVRNAVEQELGEKLVPITRNEGDGDPEIHPERFLPRARHGADGYARVTAVNEVVAEAWAKRVIAKAMGGLNGAQRLVETYVKNGLSVAYVPPMLLTRREEPAALPAE